MIKKITKLVLLAILSLSLFSCATTKVSKEEKKENTQTVEVKEDKAKEESTPPSSDSEEVTIVVEDEKKDTKEEITKTTLTRSEDSFFWTIKGKDKNGKEANLYILGTFHVGDDRIYPLHDDVEQAFVNSDRYVSEIASKDFVNLIPETQARMLKSNLREAKVIEANGGKTYIEELKPVHVALLKELSGGDEFLNINSQFEPWVLLQNISNMPVIMSGLDPNKGLDTILLSRLQSEGKETLGLDELSLQLDILEFGEREEQIQAIKSTLDEILEDPQKVINEIKDFYEAYITADEKKIKKIVKKTFSDADTDYEKQLNEIILINRNISWAKQFEEFLNEGGNTFIFAGCAHFIGDKSVFNYMKKNGVFDK